MSTLFVDFISLCVVHVSYLDLTLWLCFNMCKRFIDFFDVNPRKVSPRLLTEGLISMTKSGLAGVHCV